MSAYINYTSRLKSQVQCIWLKCQPILVYNSTFFQSVQSYNSNILCKISYAIVNKRKSLKVTFDQTRSWVSP